MENIIKIDCETREIISKSKIFLGISNENNIETLKIELDKPLIETGSISTLDIEFPDSQKTSIVMDNKDNKTAQIEIKSSLLAQAGLLKLEFVLKTKGVTTFKSEIFTMLVKEAINATATIEEEYVTIIDFLRNEIEDLKNQIKNLGAADFTEINTKIENIEQTIRDLPSFDDTEIQNILKETKDKIEQIQQEQNKQKKDILTNTNKITLLETQSGSKINLSINTTDYVMTLELLNSNDEVISSKNIDFPLESMVVNGRFENNNIVLTLQNGNEVSFSVASLVNGLINQETFDTFKDEINQKIAELQNQIQVSKATIIIAEDGEVGATVELPFSYKVGSDCLDVFYQGRLLSKATDNLLQGHYFEVGEINSVSNQIQITNDWYLEKDKVVNILIRGRWISNDTV